MSKRKTVFEVYEKKRQHTDERNKTRVFLGDSFKRWRAVKAQSGLQTDAQVARFLLDSYEEKSKAASTPSPPDTCPSCGFALVPCSVKNKNQNPNEDNEPEIIEVTLESESEESWENKQNKGGENSEDFKQYYTLTETSKSTNAAVTDEEEEEEEESAEAESREEKKLCIECGALYTKKHHECEHKTKPFVCNACGKRCVSESALKIHNGIHTETYEVSCKYCLLRLQTDEDKVSHEAVHQEQQDPFKCPECTKTFPSFRLRSEHLNNHWDENRFKCTACGSRFKDAQQLHRHVAEERRLRPHERLPSTAKPHVCQHCHKSFSYNIGLKSHMQRCHSTEHDDVPSEEKQNV